MGSEVLVLVILLSILLLYLLYFWTNSGPLSEKEVGQLATSQRFWDVSNYFRFSNSGFEIDKRFKSTLNKGGQIYRCSEAMIEFPAIASALLKGKKHEWVVFAFCRDKTIYSFYTNKGDNNQSVSLNISAGQIIDWAQSEGSDIVLQFHNHPNAILSSSAQDRISTNYFGKMFTESGMTFLTFVCGAGQFHQYGWWLADSFYQINDYLNAIQRHNGSSRSTNFTLRKEMWRKNSFMNARLNNSVHNIPADQ